MATSAPPVPSSATAPPPPPSPQQPTYPGALGLFKPSVTTVMRVVWPLILIALITGGVFLLSGIFLTMAGVDTDATNSYSVGINLSGKQDLATNAAKLVENIASFFAGIMMTYILLSSVRGSVIKLGAAFQYALKNFVRFILAYILAGLVIIAGFMCLIIPGIIVAIRLTPLSYVLIDDDRVGGYNAFKRTWTLTKGHSGKIFSVGVVSVLMFLLPFLTLLTGAMATGVMALNGTSLSDSASYLFTLIIIACALLAYIPAMFYSAAIPLLYTYLTGTTTAAPPPTPAVIPPAPAAMPAQPPAPTPPSAPTAK